MTSRSEEELYWCTLKPLSMNEAYMGRKRKTAKYRNYETELPLFLPGLEIPSKGPLALTIRAGFSNRSSDLDNCFKPFIDILQREYSFNDNRIYEINATKVKVPVGDEYIAFNIYALDHEPTDDQGD